MVKCEYCLCNSGNKLYIAKGTVALCVYRAFLWSSGSQLTVCFNGWKSICCCLFLYSLKLCVYHLHKHRIQYIRHFIFMNIIFWFSLYFWINRETNTKHNNKKTTHERKFFVKTVNWCCDCRRSRVGRFIDTNWMCTHHRNRVVINQIRFMWQFDLTNWTFS